MKIKMMISNYKIWLFIDIKNKNKIILIFLLIFAHSLKVQESIKSK